MRGQGRQGCPSCADIRGPAEATEIERVRSGPITVVAWTTCAAATNLFCDTANPLIWIKEYRHIFWYARRQQSAVTLVIGHLIVY
jgi:hypothetical protein